MALTKAWWKAYHEDNEDLLVMMAAGYTFTFEPFRAGAHSGVISVTGPGVDGRRWMDGGQFMGFVFGWTIGRQGMARERDAWRQVAYHDECTMVGSPRGLWIEDMFARRMAAPGSLPAPPT